MIYLFDIQYDVSTAGPDLRTEVFLAGCSKAKSYPCPGCFNPKLWDRENSRQVTVDDLLDHIVKYSSKKKVTFCGGEPTDQLEELTEICRKLKAKDKDFNILVYTYHDFDKLIDKPEYKELFRYIDYLIDRPYDETKRIYDNQSDLWIKRSIGSYNQRIIKFSSLNGCNDRYVDTFDIHECGRISLYPITPDRIIEYL